MIIGTLVSICATPIIINLTSEPWTSLDEKSLKQAQKTCLVEYDSCLKKFIKKETQVYWAIC